MHNVGEVVRAPIDSRLRRELPAEWQLDNDLVVLAEAARRRHEELEVGKCAILLVLESGLDVARLSDARHVDRRLIRRLPLIEQFVLARIH